jgi:2-polyprenyl-3-methyl-5-hydroxy-6-metoxy-1,4-benzoquinol methylase
MTTLPTQPTATDVEVMATADDLAGRLFEAALGAVDLLSIHLGDRLGLYRAVDELPEPTAAAVAARTGVHERYAREWLEQQAVTGFLTTSGDGDSRRFAVPVATREVLLDPTSLNYLAPLARMVAASAVKTPELLTAYRSGGGVSWDDLGPDAREAQADMNRPWFEQHLGAALGGVPALHEVLSRPGARIADLGCGGGWSSIALARAYPDATVDGYDVDAPSVGLATGNSVASGVGDRATFHRIDVAGANVGEGYDAVFAFECVHDLSNPVDFLATARRATAADGVTVVMDEAVQPQFTAPGDELERFMYGCSLLVCLPDGMSTQPTAATGTVMREGTLRGYAQAAGFRDVEVLPIQDFSFFRFYRLV